MRLLELFCGRWGWSRAFAERGWECVGVDLVEPPEIPAGCTFVRGDILKLWKSDFGGLHIGYDNDDFGVGLGDFDFICASSPCEQFSVHGMKHFHPNPPYPALGIKLFEHTRALCEASGVPYVMENVRAAQAFVGNAVNHCNSFYLWGSDVPLLMPQGIGKGFTRAMGRDSITGKRILAGSRATWSGSEARKNAVAKSATIPPELSSCVADYAERILEQRREP